MFNVCEKCGCTLTEARVDAAALRLQNHYESGVYTCCQIVEWATEQWEAWTDAAIQDGDNLFASGTVSPATELNLKQFLSPHETAVLNWDAVARIFQIEFTDC